MFLTDAFQGQAYSCLGYADLDESIAVCLVLVLDEKRITKRVVGNSGGSFDAAALRKHFLRFNFWQ